MLVDCVCVISPTVFGMLVLMALATPPMTSPLLDLILRSDGRRRRPGRQPAAAGTQQPHAASLSRQPHAKRGIGSAATIRPSRASNVS
jgi:hypothetical protein